MKGVLEQYHISKGVTLITDKVNNQTLNIYIIVTCPLSICTKAIRAQRIERIITSCNPFETLQVFMTQGFY